MPVPKGVRPGGRQKGTPNKITGTVKMMVLDALAGVGGVKYLKQQAKENPVAFMALLAKIMPTQVVGDITHEFVARLPHVEEDPQVWLEKYAPKELTMLPSLPQPTTKGH
jgi:hypothetical protein